ncbi:MAG: Fic family protein [archaeon]
MVIITKKIIGNQEYYYLEHSIRVDGNIKKKEKYLGKILPAASAIDILKKEFLTEIYTEKWRSLLNKIKNNYSLEQESMPDTLKEKEDHIFAIRFTSDTQRIEGSKLTLRETADLLENGTSPGKRPLSDIKETEAHKKVFSEMLEYNKDLSLQIVLRWHKNLFGATKPEIAGKLRQHQVAIFGSRFIPPFPAEIYPLINEFFNWYTRNRDNIPAVELAALVHHKFVTIHPFGDGNGRISRLMMNFVLKKKDYPLLNIPYEKRSSYYNALERSQVKKDEFIFLQWFLRRYVIENKRYLK